MNNIQWIFAVLILSSCGKPNESSTAELEKPGAHNTLKLTEKQLTESKVVLGKLEEKELSATIKVNGRIDVPPQNLLSVSAPLGAYLKSTKLLPGMHLAKGEVIAVLEDQQYIQLQQDYLTTQAKLEQAELEFKRQKELNESKASSDKAYQQAKSEFQSLKINLSALGQKLRLIEIDPNQLNDQTLSKSITLHAPFDGFVSKVNANIGKYVSPTDVLFELVNPNDIHLNLRVFEKDLIQMEIGQKLKAYTNSNPGKKFNCEIILISKDIAPDRTAEVHCHFENYDKNLLPGMYMNADIQLNNKKSWVLPEQAVLFFDGTYHVFVKNGVFFTLTPVEIGIKESGWIEILHAEQLKNQSIVVESAYTLLMALKNKAD
ncbi:MAG: efflux RND transporter periplasmic adaptor subunit [Bacteroidia bacterium]|nr:efflux RND transporter periplasmic adaptor subunit [Bacteroidia bacterium]